jgi:hypothetical protein
MAGMVVLTIYEPGERADELLAAIADALGLTEPLRPNWEDGAIAIPVDDVDGVREAIEDALDAAGDDGRLIVRVRYPG